MTPKWKKAGPDGEIEIKFPTGRRFKIEKQYDVNMRTYDMKHKGQFKVLEWDTGSRDWEWSETYSPKAYAKQKVMEMGQYDKKGKKVADHSKYMRRFESVDVTEDAPAGANVASIPNPATTAMGPKFKPMSVTDRRRKKDKTVLLKRFRTYMDDKNNG